jgi:hypothetical protein
MANTDPFDFISTRVEPKSVLTDVRDTLSLMPLVDADYRVGSIDTNGAVSNTTNPLSLFDTIAQNISKLPDNAPAYQYTTQQEKRYSNPNLQFTPTNILGTDTEDIYGRYQSAWDQLGNAVVKFGANVVGTFASSYLSTPATLDLIRSGKYVDAFAEDHPFAGVQNWLTALEDKYPNYYTEWERDHPYLSAITPTGAANFWGDKVVKNIGFSIGGLAAGLVQDSLIELATAGTATPATFIAAANQLNKFRSNLFRGFRNLTKGADKIDDIIDASRVTGNLAKGLQVSKLSQVGTGARFAGISYLNAQGESFIEGYHTYIDTKKQLLEEAIQSGDTSPETLAKIEQLSQDAGRYTTGINLPILTLSNWFQFSNLLYGKAMLGEAIGKQFVKTELTDTGIKYVSDFTLKKGLKQWAIETLKDSASEGFEEGAQYHVSNSLHDYYVDRMNPTIKEGLMGHLLSSVPKSLTDKQFWEESFLGALTGTLMGSYTGISKVTGGKERYENLVNTLNKDGGPLQRFNSTVNQFSKAIDLSNPNADHEVTKHDALFGTIHDSLKFGTFDTFVDSLEDLKSLEVQDYNTKFQTEFETKIEKDLHVQDMIEESYQMKEDVLKVNRAFPKNPYSSNKLTQKIKRAFSNKSAAELDAIQGYLFNDFKEVLARNESLLRKTKGKVLQHKDNLKSLGVKSETIDYMMNLGRSPKGLDSYLKFKKAQLKDLERNVKYYESLGRADNSLTPEVNISEELRNAKQLLDETTQYFERIQELHQQLKTDPKNKAVQDTVRSEVLWEETSEDQRSRYVEERKKAQEELEKEGEKEDTLIIENDDLHKAEESKTAEQLVDLKQQEEELSEVLPEVTPVPEPIIPANKWLDKFEQGKRVQIKGKWYNIIGKTDDALVVNDPTTNIDYEATKDKQGRWKLTGIGLKSVIDEELNVIQPSEPVQKVITKTKLSEKVQEQTPVLIKDYLNKIVYYRGKPYKVIDEGINNFVLFSESSIIELGSDENRDLNELNVLLPSQVSETGNVIKYNIEFQNEKIVTVNGIQYTIITSSNGNVIGLIPNNKPDQTIKNEKLLIAIEIERNKNEFDEIVEIVSDEQYETLKEENYDLLLLEGVYQKNLSTTVESGLNKLYSEKELTGLEKLAVDLWLLECFKELTQLYIKHPSSEVFKNAYDNLEIISLLLNNENVNKYEKQIDQNVSTTVSPQRETTETIARVEEPKNQTNVIKPESTAVEQQQPVTTEEVVDEYPSQPVEEAEVITEVIPTLTINQEEFTRDEIVNYPNTIWIKSEHSLENRIPVYSIEDSGVKKRNIVTGAGVLPRIGEASKAFNGKLPNYKFKQVLRPDEEVVTKGNNEQEIKRLEEQRQEELDKIERRDARFKIDPSVKNPIFNVGDRFTVNHKAIVEDYKIPYANLSKEEFDKLSPEEQKEYQNNPYEVIIKVVSPAEVNEKGEMIKNATVVIGAFKNKEEADRYILEELNRVTQLKNKLIKQTNEKYDNLISKLSSKQSSTSDNLDKFLGKYSSMKEIFQQQIDNNKFELIC